MMNVHRRSAQIPSRKHSRLRAEIEKRGPSSLRSELYDESIMVRRGIKKGELIAATPKEKNDYAYPFQTIQ